MRQKQRSRHYVSSATLLVLSPLFRYSLTRDAYVLRLLGQRVGPVLRANRRHRGARSLRWAGAAPRDVYTGPERRHAGQRAGVQLAASRG